MIFDRYLNITITFEKGAEIIYTQDMKITFSLNSLINQINSKAQINIYNPSQEQIDRIASNAGKATITFDAGYKDNHGVIFVGSIMNAVQLKQEADIILTLYCWTCQINVAEYKVNSTFNKGITNIDLLKNLASKIDFVKKIEIDKNIPVEILKYNAVKVGRVSDYIDNLAHQYGFVWQVFGNVFRAEKICNDTNNPVRIDEKSGLIGIPQKTLSGAELKVFLNSNLKINRKIQLECNYSAIQLSDISVRTYTNTSVNGTYYIHQLSFEGETRGNAWYANIVAHTYSYATA